MCLWRFKIINRDVHLKIYVTRHNLLHVTIAIEFSDCTHSRASISLVTWKVINSTYCKMSCTSACVIWPSFLQSQFRES